MDETASVKLITALANIWTAIRARHPEVPAVVLIPAPAPRGQGNVLGHFAPLRWSARKTGDQFIHEVVVVAEHLDRNAEEIAETLLHEASHALNAARAVHDCSASQYHNGYFRDAALELGLDVAQVQHYGYAFTTLPETTAAFYRPEIDALDQVLVHRRKALVVPRSPPTGGGNGTTGTPTDDGSTTTTRTGRSRKATCRCDPPNIIRVAKATLERTDILCTTCQERFALANS